MIRSIRSFFVVLKTLMTVVMLALSCAPPVVLIRSTTDTPSVTTDSVVTLIEPILITDFIGVPIGTGYQTTCNAFCIERLGTRYLVTAAHCVDGLSHGSEFQYLKPNGWGAGRAKLIWFDPDGDRAIASVDDPGLVPLVVDTDYEPQPFDLSFSASTYFNEQTNGHVLGPLSGGYYDTTLTIVQGWSGSPVLNENGKVWGIVSKCHFDLVNWSCYPNYAIVTQIP